MRTFSLYMLLVLSSSALATSNFAPVQLRAGAAAIDISPQTFPVAINGGMTAASANAVTNPIHARAIVLEHGQQQVAIVVVDSCMMSRQFLDEANALASNRTGIRADRMLISATHARSVQVNAGNYTAVRQWTRRPDRIAEDPFGNKTVRANMHAGRVWDDVTGEAGPEDPDLSLPRWTWAQVRLERRGNDVKVMLDQLVEHEDVKQSYTVPVIEATAPLDIPRDSEELFFGGRGNRDSSWEGRLDEIVIKQIP